MPESFVLRDGKSRCPRASHRLCKHPAERIASGTPIRPGDEYLAKERGNKAIVSIAPVGRERPFEDQLTRVMQG